LLLSVFVTLAWIPFRASDFSTSLAVVSNLFSLNSGQTSFSISSGYAIAILLAMFALHHCRNAQLFVPIWRNAPAWLFGTGMGVAYALAISLRAVDYQPFIYFQF
jgi:alginate O-acetyltransferase complex protein AlgI